MKKKKKHFATPYIGEIEIRDLENWVFYELKKISIMKNLKIK